MASGDATRALLGSPIFRRGLLIAALLFGAGFMALGLSQGVAGDRCARELVEAARTKDVAWLDAHLTNPSLEVALQEAESVELLFVRPSSPEWTRIGLALKKSASATVAEPLFVLLDNEAEGSCTFLQDYGP